MSSWFPVVLALLLVAGPLVSLLVEPAAATSPTVTISYSKSRLTVSLSAVARDPDGGRVVNYTWGMPEDHRPYRTLYRSAITHRFTTPGTYGFSVTVVDDDGESNSAYVEVDLTNAAPLVTFQTVASGLVVRFDPTGTRDPDGTIRTYDWDFGDGSARASTRAPTHTYANPGPYTATLIVTDDGSASTSTTRTFTVYNGIPVARFSASTSALAVTADGRSSTDAEGRIRSYLWDWGDGKSGASGAIATHEYAAEGTYRVMLTTFDERGDYGITTREVTVRYPNVPPFAIMRLARDGATVSAEGRSSADPDGRLASYSWSWGDGSANTTGAAAGHAYQAPGNYTVTLTVRDDEGASASTARAVEVAAALFVPRPTLRVTPYGQLVVAVVDAEPSAGGALLSVAWDWGDGSAVDEGPVAGPGRALASHRYDEPGIHVVRVTAVDEQGRAGTDAARVRTEAAPDVRPASPAAKHLVEALDRFDHVLLRAAVASVSPASAYGVGATNGSPPALPDLADAARAALRAVADLHASPNDVRAEVARQRGLALADALDAAAVSVAAQGFDEGASRMQRDATSWRIAAIPARDHDESPVPGAAPAVVALCVAFAAARRRRT